MWVERCFNLALRFKYKVSSFASYPGCVRATVWVPDVLSSLLNVRSARHWWLINSFPLRHRIERLAMSRWCLELERYP